MPKKYVVRLSPEEREQLHDLVRQRQDASLPNKTRERASQGPMQRVRRGWIDRSRRPFRAIGQRLRASGSVL